MRRLQLIATQTRWACKTRIRPLAFPKRVVPSAVTRRWASGASISSDPAPNPSPVDEPPGEDKKKGEGWGGTAFKMAEAALTTLASVAILGIVGYSYTRYYKYMVLEKIEHAFDPGDPVLELAARGKQISMIAPLQPDDTEDLDHQHWIIRKEQTKINDIISGKDRGHYYLLIGEKGTGKTSMLIDAMSKNGGEGVSMFEAHADPEIFRIRLGRALDFEFHEDNIGSLFSIRGPRDAGAILDIERAFNKLEKVALRRRDKVGRPLILIINSVHLLRDDENGRDLIELLQQRAEAWAASNLCTIVLNSDDYWVYERLKNYATRMQVMPIGDLNKEQAMMALRNYRVKYFPKEEPSEEMMERVYDKVGGRLTFLNRVAKFKDMLPECDRILITERTWFLNQCWILGEEMDDDVMDQQKFASAAMVLAKALVDKEKEMKKTYDPKKGYILPEIPLHEARQIMTRADFIQDYDRLNLFTIDSVANVRADSVPMQNAFREVCQQEGFEEHLEATLDRISAIESLGRTRELTIKDLWNNGKYKVTARNARGNVERDITFEVQPGKEEKEEDDEDGS